MQTFSGGALTAYGAYFFVQAGFSPTNAYDLSVGMYGAAIIAHLLCLVLMRYYGRRTLYMWGCGLMSITLFAAGAVGTQPSTPSNSWALAVLIILVSNLFSPFH